MDRPLNIKGPDVVWDQLTALEQKHRDIVAAEHAARRAARSLSEARKSPQSAAFGRRLTRFAAQLEE